jgi:hypothetical protein
VFVFQTLTNVQKSRVTTHAPTQLAAFTADVMKDLTFKVMDDHAEVMKVRTLRLYPERQDGSSQLPL